jgi:hypothetical protein
MTTHIQHTTGKEPTLRFPDGLIDRIRVVLVAVAVMLKAVGL